MEDLKSDSIAVVTSGNMAPHVNEDRQSTGPCGEPYCNCILDSNENKKLLSTGDGQVGITYLDQINTGADPAADSNAEDRKVERRARIQSSLMPIQIFLDIASYALIGQQMYRSFARCCRAASLFYLTNFPLGKWFARRPWVLIGFLLLQSFHRRPLGTIATAGDKNVTLLVWGLVVFLLHGGNFCTPIWPLNRLSSFLTNSWTAVILYSLGVIALSAPNPLWSFVIRKLAVFPRVDRGLWRLRTELLSNHIFDWVKPRLDHLIEYFVYYILIQTVWRLIYGAEVYNWFDWEGYRNTHQHLWRFKNHTPREENPAKHAPSYKHAPLQTPQTIRLLLLFPRSQYSCIRCSIVHVPLSKAPKYEAISYTWGNPKKVQTILVDGHAFKVTQSVYELLQETSSIYLPRLYWIDSICIDQENKAEKSEQVRLMGQIYSQAFLVTVWLGRYPTSEDVTAEVIEYFMPSFATNAADGMPDLYDAGIAVDLLDELYYLLAQESNPSRAAYREYGQPKDPKMLSMRWRALLKMLRHPWFERIWVVQEVTLASSIRVRYGDEELSWQNLVDRIEPLVRNPTIGTLLGWAGDTNERSTPPQRSSNVLQIASLRQKREENEIITLDDVLLACQHYKATDPRDIIFATHGMISKYPSHLMLADYSASEEDVFLNAAEALCNKAGFPVILSRGGIGNLEERHPAFRKLASWCPDWTQKTHHAPLTGKKISAPYLAGGHGGFNVRLDAQRLFPVLGIFVDTIQELGPILRTTVDVDGTWQDTELDKFTHAYDETWTLVNQSTRTRDPYPHIDPTQPLQEAFWRSMIGDRAGTTRPAPATCEKFFQDWEQNIRRRQHLSESNIPHPNEYMPQLESVMQFVSMAAFCSSHRRLYITVRGFIGFCPPYTHVNDVVYVVLGVGVPVVFRKVSTSEPRDNGRTRHSRYLMVGECYAHGIMDGEATRWGRPTVELEIV